MALQVVATDHFVILVSKAVATGGSMRLYQHRTEVAQVAQLLQDAAYIPAAATRFVVARSPAFKAWGRYEETGRYVRRGKEVCERANTQEQDLYMLFCVRRKRRRTSRTPPVWPPGSYLSPCFCPVRKSLHEVAMRQVGSGHRGLRLLMPVHSPHLTPTDQISTSSTGCPGLGRDLREPVRRSIGGGLNVGKPRWVRI